MNSNDNGFAPTLDVLGVASTDTAGSLGDNEEVGGQIPTGISEE